MSPSSLQSKLGAVFKVPRTKSRRLSTISFLSIYLLLFISIPLVFVSGRTTTKTSRNLSEVKHVDEVGDRVENQFDHPFLSRPRQDELDDAERADRNITAKRQSFNIGGTISQSTPFTIALGQPYNTRPYTSHFLTEKEATRLNTPQLIEAVGYKVEAHKVTTEDGYVLTIFRVKNPKMKCLNKTKPPIFFQHGVVDSSRAWLVLDGDTSAPYTATKYGYDVWLGNSRGTSYSLWHTRYSHKDPRFWKFSWHEMGKYDLPIFRYILKATTKTNLRQQINYVGHSMGTTMFYVCLSLYPEFNKVIANMIALPPSSYLSSITSPLQFLRPYAKLYQDVLIDGPFLWSEVNHLIHKIGPITCKFEIPVLSTDEVCLAFVALAEGASYLEKNSTIIHRVLGGFPDTTSKKTIAHFLQLVSSKYFTQFDYGVLGNYRHYGSSVPPKYNLFNVAVRTLNLYGQQDILIDYKDSETSNDDLGTGADKYNTLIFDYSHVDFIWGQTAGPVIASRIFRFLESEPPENNPLMRPFESNPTNPKQSVESNSTNAKQQVQSNPCTCPNKACRPRKKRPVDIGKTDYYTDLYDS